MCYISVEYFINDIKTGDSSFLILVFRLSSRLGLYYLLPPILVSTVYCRTSLCRLSLYVDGSRSGIITRNIECGLASYQLCFFSYYNCFQFGQGDFIIEYFYSIFSPYFLINSSSVLIHHFVLSKWVTSIPVFSELKQMIPLIKLSVFFISDISVFLNASESYVT